MAPPVPLTSIIGRDQELAALRTLLASADQRLVTVTGPGGSGKTRLVLEAVTHLQDEFVDGVAFVDLAPVREAHFVLPTIAGALGARERPGEPLPETLTCFLAPKQFLILLDNCEHVLSAAPQFATLLTACPRLSMLATSREALRIRGEHIFALSPLELPESGGQLGITELAHVPAVALFVERATASHPAFALIPANAATVVAICERLDGLPLAIELAAAHVRALSPAALLDLLERRLPVLTGGSQDLPPRQRTMRDAIAWSYELLNESERVLFRCLSIFAGGWTLEAATAVSCGRSTLDVLDGLEALLQASLVQGQEHPGGERRFAMLETIREFGVEQLATNGEAEEMGRRHTAYVLKLASLAAAATATAAVGDWLARLEAEQGNLRAALAWLRDHQEGETGLALVAALGSFWHVRGAHAEGRAWLETFLAMPHTDGEQTPDRIAALRWVGELAGLQGDTPAAQAYLEQSLNLARQAGDKRGIAVALRAIGSAMIMHGDVPEGIRLLTEAVALSRELGDLRQTAFLLAYLACAVGQQGDVARGAEMAAESEALLRSLGDRHSFEACFTPFAHGWLAIIEGDYDRARTHFEISLAAGQAIAANGVVAIALFGMGEVALAEGDIATAARRFREGALLSAEVDLPMGIAFNLQGLARIVAATSDPAPAAHLIGALDPFVGTLRVLPRRLFAHFEGAVATVSAAMGEEGFAVAREAGQALSAEDAVHMAVALTEGVVGREPSR
jgi:predicted ATPase